MTSVKKPPPAASQKLNDRQLLILLGAGIGLLFAMKLILAASLDLYSDEIFYWLASTRPALAYSDLPFVTAQLVRLGALLDAGNPLAVRSVFILLGSSLPLLVYWLAKPLSGHRAALQSAVLTLCLPMGGFMGLLAVPDVPLIFFGLLSLGFFERALRSDRNLHWLGTGIFVALGMSTHYRYFLYPLAAVVFLIVYPDARRQWRNPKLWITGLIAALGLIPILWFNLHNQLASASFYLVDRHPWQFQARGLLHLFEQAIVVTPGLYFLFGFTLWSLLKNRERLNSGTALLCCAALSNGLVYLVLAPWSDADSTSIHWPLSAYFPLLVFTPQALKELSKLVASKISPAKAHLLLLSIPAVGFFGTLAAFAGVGSQAFQIQLQPLLGSGVLSNKMAGWNEFAQHTANLLETEFPDQSPIIISDNYYTAGQIAFAGIRTNPFTLDEDKAVRDGRITQLRLWEMNEVGLRHYYKSPALFISEDSTLNVEEKFASIGKMCHQAIDLHYLDTLILFGGDKQFSFYGSSAIADSNTATQGTAKPCPYPARAWLESPMEGDMLSGNVPVSGWAFKEDIGIESLSLILGGEIVKQLNYGIVREDVVTAMSVSSDPNRPNLGFAIELDSRDLQNGDYTLELELKGSNGEVSRYGKRSITVSN